MSKSGMLISAPSAPSANGSVATRFGTSDPKLAWRNFTSANSAQAPPGHSVDPRTWSDAPSRSVRRGLPGETGRLTIALAVHSIPTPSREVSLSVLVVCGLSTQGAGRVTIRSISIAPVVALWAVSTAVWTYGVVYYSRNRQYRAAGEEGTPHNAHRTPDAVPVPERSRPATAHPSAPRRPNCTTAESSRPHPQLEAKCPKAAPTRSLSL